ncbi:hypothetical protein D6779_09500 [Candidatus Parcubacteria bacterium]|nr:MAG: hypothetical protein D6779_09500 [Candidatus Parcubacteria bacterium]
MSWRGIARFLIRDRHDAWSFLNVGGRFAFRLVTLSLLVRVLSPEELALWYVFIAAFGVSAILEGGVKLVVTQQVAARPRRVVAPFCLAVLRLYRRLVAVVCLVALLFGDWWLTHKMGVPADGTVRMLWPVFVLANGIGLLSGIQGGIISGLGEVAISQRNELIGQLMNGLAFIALWGMGGGGLLLPVAALLAASMVVWCLNLHFLKELLPKRKINIEKKYLTIVALKVVKNASAMLLLLVSYQMLSSGFLLFISANDSKQMTASFGLSVQILNVVISMGSGWLNPSFQRMASAKGNINRLRSEFSSLFKRSAIILPIGMIVMLIFSAAALKLLNTEMTLLPSEYLRVLALLLIIEYLLGTLGINMINSQGKYIIPMAISMMYSLFSLLGIYLSYIWFGWGVLGAIYLRLIGALIYGALVSIMVYQTLSVRRV